MSTDTIAAVLSANARDAGDRIAVDDGVRQLTYGAAANSLRGLTKRSQKRATHALTIDKPGFRGDHFHGVSRPFYHDPGRFQPELFDGLGGRLSRLGSKCAAELTRAEMGDLSQLVDRER